VENGLSAQGMLNLHTGLVNSCNTVFYQIGAELDKQDSNYLPDMAKAFGLGKATGIPYFPEVSGTIPDPKWKSEVVGDGWATGDAVNLSIGQGYMQATPLQMANAYAAIANGGTLLQPYVVDRTHVVGGSGTEQVGERVEIGKLGLNEAQIKELQSALRDQTSNPNGVGSSKVFGDFGWPISGKTGTAQNQLDGTDKPHSWFAAYGPADGDATIASVVLIENAGEGVSYAAPVTKVIYDAYIKSNLSKVEP
jgi:penicillin-binding protein 2